MTKNTSYQNIEIFDIEAEKALLGAILISKDTSMAIDEINQIIQFSDFYRKANQDIYLAMNELASKNTAVDVITLVENLNSKQKLDNVGGVAYIADLNNYVPSAINIKKYAFIVKDKAIRRNLIHNLNNITETAKNGDININELLDRAEKAVLNISNTTVAKDNIVEPKEYIMQTLMEIENRYNNKTSGKLFGIDTGFKELNNITGGLQKSDLIILAGRPSMGKTAFAVNLALNITKKDIPVAIFSLEMSINQLANRLFSQKGQINSNNIRNGTLDDTDIKKLVTTARILSDKPLYIDDTAELTISKLRSKARKLKREKNIQLIMIDYLQLMKGASNKKGDRQQEISDISRGLKLLARELDITIIALSQLSRAVESRTIKKPMLSDLRESGSIEQDADIVMFLYRDEYYNADTKAKGLTEVIISKHRNGATGSINLKFDKNYCLFEDV